jgi:hypothetical protein
LTNFADHCKQFSHEAINRYLGSEKVTPRLVWDNVVGTNRADAARGFILFDDTVLDKNYSFAIDYWIYDPDGEGKSKLDPVQEMLTNVVYQKQLPFQAMLMDTGLATHNLMLCVHRVVAETVLLSTPGR